MDQPLFVCVVDKEREELQLFSCAPIWWLLFDPDIKPKSIRVHPGRDVTLPPITSKKNGQYSLGIGPPVLSQTILQLEQKQNSDLAYTILRAWALP
jgi:hypothetical protein